MIPILLSVILTARSNGIVDLYQSLFENYNKVKIFVYCFPKITLITKKAIKNIPPVGGDSMLTALNISIDIDWITKVETSQSQPVV